MNFQSNNFTTYQLIQESYQMNFVVAKINDSTVKISWNLPVDENNSTANLMYNGLVIIASSVPINTKLVNETKYEDDNTTNPTTHVGDKIGDALVVFSAYDDLTTKECLITTSTQPYFYAYVVDRHLRYIPFPIALSSVEYRTRPELTKALKATNLLEITNKTVTDLVQFDGAPNPTEQIIFCYDFPGTKVTFTYNTAGLTYENLIIAFNTFTKQQSADYVNNVPFNQGVFWLNNDIVIEWDGYRYIPHITHVQTTQPHIVADGVVWKNGNVFKIRNNPLWDNISVLNKPSLQTMTGDIWFNGTQAYKWEGNVWVDVPTYIQTAEPGIPNYASLDGKYWLNSDNNQLFHIEQNRLVRKSAITNPTDPLLLSVGSIWVNPKTQQVYDLTVSGWELATSIFGTTCDTSTSTVKYYFDKQSNQLFNLLTDMEITDFIIWNTDPLLLPEFTLWLDDNNNLFIRNNGVWVSCDIIVSPDNPLVAEMIEEDSFWNNNGAYSIYNGMWVPNTPIVSLTDPNTVLVGGYVYANNVLYVKTLAGYDVVPVISSLTDPAVSVIGECWLNGSSLSIFNGLSYTPIMYTLFDPRPANDFKWYQPSTNKLFKWDDFQYVEVDPNWEMIWDNGLLLQNNTPGSNSGIAYTQYHPINGMYRDPILGNDAVSPIRTQNEQFIGGNEQDITERRDTIEYIRRTLGAPDNVVELTEAHLNDCVDAALRTLRLYSTVSKDKKVFLMEFLPRESKYILSNRRLGYHTIIDVLQVYRLPSSFLTAVGSQQIYGQLVLQQLYQAGSFDLVSYHLIASYIELLEKMFASKIRFYWKEYTRELTLYNTTGRNEIVLVDCMVDRTENDLLSDRRTEDWLKRWAVAEARERLSEIRGKFTTLPGAGGGISLNASDLHQKATEDKERCMMELESYVVEEPERVGGAATFIMG